MVKGIDVSFWQGDIDWRRVSSGADFVMIKATQGRGSSGAELFEDRKFRENIVGASAAGISCGVYHYFTAADAAAAEREAEYFLSVITPYKDKITLWAAADVEDDGFLAGASKEQLTAAVQRFCDIVASAGFLPMVYSNGYYTTERIGSVRGAARWLALWREDLTKPEGYGDIKLWQYTSSGAVSGIDGRVDMNVGYFDLQDTPVSAEPQNPAAAPLAPGDTVRVKNPVIYGTQMRFKLYYDRYTVIEVNGDRVVIGVDGTVTAAVNAENLEKIPSGSLAADSSDADSSADGGSAAAPLAPGDTVRVKNPVIYGTQMRFKLYYDRYTVIEVNGDRVVIGVDGTVTAAVNAENLEKT